ncbi:DUF1572 family protein [Flagellimonas meridianipacifica]|uniref:Uncharacterized protein DUF1572 n=1 Tax=Flagellimonas meridianipacifica TaxID=1080225 RepID=A0A2T0M883_9FLAO|nr:DUF1572 family protein [Allomuricauda pacifica]PRX53678.1 uncharacterized protein DUF1572 [Allomuricauda pacifica]
MEENYLNSVLKQFEYYKILGEKTFAQLNEQELFWQFNEESNSIAVVVNHLWGNMKSRWTDFLVSDGEKEWRDRDSEFESVIKSKEELLKKWHDGWSCLFQAINSVNTNNFQTEILIRNQSHSIVEAINRQMMHYAYHIGQIVYIGRMIKGKKWQSLSIPKGKSNDFNTEKFSRGKHKGHYTDGLK